MEPVPRRLRRGTFESGRRDSMAPMLKQSGWCRTNAAGSDFWEHEPSRPVGGAELLDAVTAREGRKVLRSGAGCAELHLFAEEALKARRRHDGDEPSRSRSGALMSMRDPAWRDHERAGGRRE